MSLIRRVARPLIAAPFVYEGVQTAIRPQRAIEILPLTMEDLDKDLDKVNFPVDAETLIRVTGAVSAVSGLAFALNKKPRLAALVLLSTTFMAVAGRKKVWELEGPEQLEEARSILGDLGLLGGVLLATVDRDGKPSFAYRLDKMIERGQKSAQEKQRQLQKAAKKGKKRSSKALTELDRSLAKKIKKA